MKRLLITAVAVTALVVPTTVGAATRHFEGDVQPGGTVTFNLVKKNGKWKVKQLSFQNVQANCGTISIAFGFAIKVKDNKFHDTGFGTGHETHVNGKFTHHKTVADGKFKPDGDYIGQANNCSGSYDWHAEKV